jgi:phosphatidylserine decarboxylase
MERAFVHAASVSTLSRTTGWLADRRFPGPILRRFIHAFVRTYQVDLSDAAQPLSSYRTFNEFFTRALRPGARPIPSDPHIMLSPADARIQILGKVPSHGRLEQIKGRRYDVETLLGGRGSLGVWRDGVHATFYLSPRDYHRVHSPVDGQITHWTHIPGRLFPVNHLAVQHVEGLFTVNERLAMFIESEHFGPVAVVMVGASNVGRISLSFTDQPGERKRSRITTVRPSAPIPIQRGDELGIFNLGSTVVLLAADATLVPQNVQANDAVWLGQPVWRHGVESNDEPEGSGSSP